MKKIVSINTKQVEELYKLITEQGPMLLADAVRHYSSRAIAELIIEHEDVSLVPDGGVLCRGNNGTN